ncbi:unnamed protein product, partial [Oppiella nova]
TKFWNFQFFYTLYLSIFSVAVLYPRCGNFYLDLCVCIWTALIIGDDIRQAYIMNKLTANTSLTFRVVEISFKMFFLTIYVSHRLMTSIESAFALFRPYDEKVVLSLGLLHAYYTLFSKFLPISPTLGPLIYRIKIMILLDFVNWIRLSILVMISFGVILQAILYPDLSMDHKVFLDLAYRAFFMIFKISMDEMSVDQSCAQYLRSNANNTDEPGVCYASEYTQEVCRVTGVWSYIFFISYFILLKLILNTLLFAIFASSSSRLASDTDTIWKYQRYGLVMDFANRTPFPPPLNFFYYCYWMCNWLGKVLQYRPFTRGHKLKFKELFVSSVESQFQGKSLADDDYTYLKLLATQVYDEHHNKMSAETMATNQYDRILANSMEMEFQRRGLRQLKGKQAEMERALRQTSVNLEYFKHFIAKKTGLDLGGVRAKKLVHVFSRQSPYPNTTVQRYPVPDKYVSWDVMWVDYDPIAYTKRKHEFGVSIQDLADEDILALQMLKLETPSIQLPVYEWNRPSTNAAGISIDRQSWEMSDNQNIIYKLENGIPINPFGRTGLRGKGSLLRWGPNHYVMLVITRLNDNELEVLVENLNVLTGVSLPVRFILGEMTYIGLEALFRTEDSEHKNWSESEKMMDWFRGFNEQNEDNNDTNNANNAHSFKCERLMKGYFDDPLNTDQAWKEMELWHIHYTTASNPFNHHIRDGLEWREVSEGFFSLLSNSQSNVIQKIVDKLNVNIR